MINDINIEQDLSNENLKQLQTISAALLMGVFLFLVVIFVYYFIQESQNTTDQSEYLELLFYLALLFSPVSILLSNFVSGKHLNKIADGETTVSNITELIQVLSTYYVVKFAILEGSAIFGGVVLILAITSGSIFVNDLLWLAIIPILVFFVAVGINFPTKDKIISIYKNLIAA